MEAILAALIIAMIQIATHRVNVRKLNHITVLTNSTLSATVAALKLSNEKNVALELIITELEETIAKLLST